MNKTQYKEVLKTIVSEMKKVVALIMAEDGGKDAEARKRFNEELYAKFNLLLHQQSVLSPLFSLYVALDEYLNNEGARILGAASKDHIQMWYADLETNIRQVETRIEALSDNKE